MRPFSHYLSRNEITSKIFLMKQTLKKIIYISLVTLVTLYLCYLDLMIGLSLRYDIMDVERVLEPRYFLIIYRLWYVRIVLTVVIITLMTAQIIEFQYNKIIAISITLIGVSYLLFYLLFRIEIDHSLAVSESLVYERATSQLRDFIDANMSLYFLCVGVFLVCRYFLLRNRCKNK